MTEQEKDAFVAFCSSLNEADKDALRPFMKDLRVRFNNLKETQNRLNLLKDLSQRLSVLDARKETLESDMKIFKEIDEIQEKKDSVILALIDKLVRERRVQKKPAEKVRKAIVFASQDLSTAIQRIEYEIKKYDKSRDFVESYIRVVDSENQANPSLESLAKESGYSKPEWSKRLSSDPSLLMLLQRTLVKKKNYAQADPKIELWIHAADVIKKRISRYSDKSHRNKELPSGSMSNVEDPDGIDAIYELAEESLQRNRRGKSNDH